MQFYPKVEKFVEESFGKQGKTSTIIHLKRTAYWLKQIKPDADEVLLVAAVSHDIERAYRDYPLMNELKQKGGYDSPEYLRLHQEKGGKIIADLLTSFGAPKEFIAKVKLLISTHEYGGNDEQNALKDADVISFFENNVDNFIEYEVKETSLKQVKEKFQWMFSRITSNKAKEIAKPLYEKALEQLG